MAIELCSIGSQLICVNVNTTDIPKQTRVQEHGAATHRSAHVLDRQWRGGAKMFHVNRYKNPKFNILTGIQHTWNKPALKKKKIMIQWQCLRFLCGLFAMLFYTNEKYDDFADINIVNEFNILAEISH